MSPHCHVAYVNGDDRTKSESRVFVERGEPEVPFDMPVVVQGVDISFFAKQIMAQAPARFREETSEFHIDPDAANENLKRRP